MSKKWYFGLTINPQHPQVSHQWIQLATDGGQDLAANVNIWLWLNPWMRTCEYLGLTVPWKLHKSAPATMDCAEAWWWGATPRPRSGAEAERSNPISKEQLLRRCRRAERSYSTFQVRRGSCEEIPLVLGKEQRLRSSGAAMKRYPKSKVEKNPSKTAGVAREHQKADKLKL